MHLAPARSLVGAGHLHEKGRGGVAAAARASCDSGDSVAYVRAGVHKLAVSFRPPPRPPPPTAVHGKYKKAQVHGRNQKEWTGLVVLFPVP